MYSVYVNKRPIKIAFLINPKQKDWQEWVDAILEYNQEKWGGRFNPIIPTNGKTIAKEWWHFLEKLDPDYVFSVFQLHDELKNEIEKRIRPLGIEVPRTLNDPDIKPSIHPENVGVSALPNSTNIGKFARLLSNDVLASVRGIHWTSEKNIFRFLLRSFGVFQDVYYIDKTLEKIATKESFRANDKSQLIQILNELAKPATDFVYPIQYSMLGKPDWWIEFEYEHSYDVFGIIVGDTFEEQVFLRNKVFYERDSSHTRLSHIWLPKAFAQDLEFMEALGNWLRRRTSNIHLFSFSISNEELEKIGENLDFRKESVGLRKELSKKITSFEKFPFPPYFKEHKFSFWDRYSPSISPPKDCDVYRANNLSDSIEIKSPSQSEGVTENGYWMAEVYIESDKNRFYNQKYYLIQNQQFWWRLPRKNYLARDIFRDKSRININGIPVVQLSAKNPFLNLQLPSELDLLKKCILGDWMGKMSGEVKRKDLEVDYVQLSNIGKYLSGFFEVFGGLALAHGYLEERSWRNMFDVLSGRDLEKDLKLRDRVGNKLRKKILSVGLTPTDRVNNFESLKDFVIDLSKEVTFDSKVLEYEDFLEVAKKEHEKFQNEEKERIDWLFSEDALNRDISKLLELGVLQMGFAQKCPRCGSNNWYLLDNAIQYLRCDGCRFEFSMPANPKISYRLSSLVRHGVFAYGLVPVVLVLGQLLKDSHSSFFFAPSLDLYKRISREPPEYKNLTDSDIVCISDGNFVIGEVKQSQDRFTLKQMLVLAEIAESIEADILLFSSLDKKISPQTKKMIVKVKEKLKKTKVQVGWYQLEERMFEPTRGDC